MPTLILVGFPVREAAGINFFALCPPSFSSLIPHIPTAQWDMGPAVPRLIAGAVGSFTGARITSLYVPSGRIRQIFGVLIVIMTAYKIYTLIG